MDRLLLGRRPRGFMWQMMMDSDFDCGECGGPGPPPKFLIPPPPRPPFLQEFTATSATAASKCSEDATTLLLDDVCDAITVS